MDYISIAWDKPPERHMVILDYQVRYQVRSHDKSKDQNPAIEANVTSVVEVTKRLNMTFRGLEQQTEYIFQVSGGKLCLIILHFKFHYK